MSACPFSTSRPDAVLEIVAFRLHDQEFSVRTTTLCEIRGWEPATPIPHAPADVIGVTNRRGKVIPIIDLANKPGMRSAKPNEHSAIVVAEVHDVAMGLVVDSVSDILTISQTLLQPVPKISLSASMGYADDMIAQPEAMICFLNLERMFPKAEAAGIVAA